MSPTAAIALGVLAVLWVIALCLLAADRIVSRRMDREADQPVMPAKNEATR